MHRIYLYTILNVAAIANCCPTHCICDYYALVHTIDCSNHDFTAIPSGIPEWSTELNFDGNYLQTLNLNDFETRQYYEELRIRYNNIGNIVIKNSSVEVPKRKGGCSFVSNLFFRLSRVNLRGNRLKELPKCLLQIWPKLQYLNMNENLITSISKLQFDRYVSYSNSLTELYLQNNRIASIKREELYFPQNPLRRLTIFDLSYNFIYAIEPGSFMFMESLTELNLSHNDIWFIKDLNFVTKGRNVEIIDLSDNAIMMISQSAFSGLPKLRKIDLQNNQISCLQPQAWFTCQIPFSLSAEENIIQFSSILGIKKFTVFLFQTFKRNFTALQEIKVGGNAWICDCKLKSLTESPQSVMLVPSLSSIQCENEDSLNEIVSRCP